MECISGVWTLQCNLVNLSCGLTHGRQEEGCLARRGVRGGYAITTMKWHDHVFVQAKLQLILNNCELKSRNKTSVGELNLAILSKNCQPPNLIPVMFSTYTVHVKPERAPD